jgi:nicotinate-nucleotide adenylyltransferase
MRTKSSPRGDALKIGLLGGSFNPLHVGHLRLCIEVMERCSLDHVQFIPAYIPPHKDLKNILPFEMRCSMIESSIRGLSTISLNRMEKERPGPSYTYDTLQTLMDNDPCSRFFFIMGGNDLLTMTKWYKGREIGLLSDIIVAGREGQGLESADDFISGFWGAQRREHGQWLVPGGGHIQYISIPRLDISSSVIRTRWLAGKNVQWLVPEAARAYLELYADEVENIWQEIAG